MRREAGSNFILSPPLDAKKRLQTINHPQLHQYPKSGSKESQLTRGSRFTGRSQIRADNRRQIV